MKTVTNERGITNCYQETRWLEYRHNVFDTGLCALLVTPAVQEFAQVCTQISYQFDQTTPDKNVTSPFRKKTTV